MDTRILSSSTLLALCGSAAVHAALVPGHAASAPLLAAAFGTSAALLLSVAAVLAARPRHRGRALVAAAVLAGTIAAYVVDRTTGLPLVGLEHAAAHSHAGSTGGPDVLGLVTKALEATGIAAALALASRAPGRSATSAFRHIRVTARSDSAA